MRAPDTRRAGRTALGSLGIRMKRRNPEKTRRSPRVDGAAWEVEYAWGIATATNAAAKRATFVSRDSRAARRNTGSATRAPRVGTRRLRTGGGKEEPGAAGDGGPRQGHAGSLEEEHSREERIRHPPADVLRGDAPARREVPQDRGILSDVRAPI